MVHIRACDAKGPDPDTSEMMKLKITTNVSRLGPVACFLRPDLGGNQEEDPESSGWPTDVLGLLCTAAIALVGLGWLIAVTRRPVLFEHGPLLLFLLGVVVLLRRLIFAVFREARSWDYIEFRGPLAGVVSWSAALSLGPTALWISGVGTLIHSLFRPPSVSRPRRWHHARHVGLELTEITASLLALGVHRWAGGTFPLGSLTVAALTPAVLATATRFVLCQLFSLPLLLDRRRSLRRWSAAQGPGRYVGVAVVLLLLVDSFAILAAALYAEAGVGIYLFFVGGVVLVGLLTNRLSRIAMRSRQRAREFERLERLGRDIIQTPVHPSTLSSVLSKHIPGMFTAFQIEVRLFPDQIIYRYPEHSSLLPDVAWDWLRTLSEAQCLLPGERHPWTETTTGSEQLTERVLITAPIFKSESSVPVGGVAMTHETQAAWGREDVATAVPAIQTLASQIGSALHGAELYRIEQELSLAGQIQSSFLPNELPDIAGWQLTAILKPARQTAGDFYDVIPLPNGRFGLVVGDVAGKGMGAALYMALARTLLRTYALEYHDRPDFAMKVTNRRLLMDTDVTMFVTVFYGVLDPRTGTLAYCNAGHSPPYLLHPENVGEIGRLTKTGMALGAMPGVSWEQRVVDMVAGDTLVLHSDGVTDAQDERGCFFGEEKLQKVMTAVAGNPAHRVQDAVIQAAQDFSGEAAQFDDITLMILVRDTEDG